MKFKPEYSNLKYTKQEKHIKDVKNMKEIISSIRESLTLIENTFSEVPKEQQTDLRIKLRHVDKDLRGIILFQMAINK